MKRKPIKEFSEQWIKELPTTAQKVYWKVLKELKHQQGLVAPSPYIGASSLKKLIDEGLPLHDLLVIVSQLDSYKVITIYVGNARDENGNLNETIDDHIDWSTATDEELKRIVLDTDASIALSPNRFDRLKGFFDGLLSEPDVQGRTNNNPPLAEYVPTSGGGMLKIRQYAPIRFKKTRHEIVQFFFDQEDRQRWVDYEDIKRKISGKSSEYLRKTVNNINARIATATDQTITVLIASRQQNELTTSPKQYRWAL